tara:strand:+ start:193 stop:411 length:219 start_codon:yes stop_codon:yes gene_type:complete
MSNILNTDKFYRDQETGALISSDNQGLKNYKLQNAKALQVTELADNINNLKAEMQDIKNDLQKILNSITQEK